MSLNVYPDVLKGGRNQEAPPVVNVPSVLTLIAVLAGLIITIHMDGNVSAALAATSRPDGDGRQFSIRKLRGLPIFISHRLIKVFLLSRLSTESFSLIRCFLLNISAELLLSTLKVTYIYAILEPNPRIPIYRSIFSWSIWANTFPASFLYSIASSICFYLPVYAFRQLEPWAEDATISREIQFAIIFTTIVILYFGIVVPAYAIFIRVAACTLLSQDDSKVARENVPSSIKSAWQSFTWSARIRFFQILAKVLLLEVLVSFLLITLVFILFDPFLYIDVAEFLVKYAG